MREEFVGLIALCLFTLGFCIGGCCEENWTATRFEKAAIEHKAAQYNPTTGKFEWLDKSGEVQ